MLDLNPLIQFSCNYCIAICAILVPANLLATLQTMLLVGFGRPISQVRLLASVASGYALLLILHVVAWLAIGVVMAPTYILTFLGCLCLLINISALILASHREIKILKIDG